MVVPVGQLQVGEWSGSTYGTGQISVRPTYPPSTWVYVTLSAPVDPVDPTVTTSVQLSLTGAPGTWSSSVTLMFAPGGTAGLNVFVRASFDLLSEGTLVSPIATATVGVAKGTVTSATSTTLTATRASAAWAPPTSGAAPSGSPAAAGPTRSSSSSPGRGDTLTLAGAWVVTPDSTSTWMITGVGSYDRKGANNVLATVVDDEAVAVVVTPPAGGVEVVEPTSGNAGGTTVHYPVRLPRAPLPGTTVTVTLSGGQYLELCLGNGTSCSGTWGSTLGLVFTGTDWSTARDIWVRAKNDGTVTGDRYLQITAAVSSAKVGGGSARLTGTVTGATGRADEFTFGGAALTRATRCAACGC